MDTPEAHILRGWTYGYNFFETPFKSEKVFNYHLFFTKILNLKGVPPKFEDIFYFGYSQIRIMPREAAKKVLLSTLVVI